MFTDIEDSTRLLKQLGDEFVELIHLHDELLRKVWSEHDGHELGTEGDSFFVAFAHADDALRAAVAVQRAIHETVWPHDVELRVRIGVHTGLANPVDDSYRALSVHQAARVVACAHGGQVFTTDDTLAACPRASKEYSTTLLGRYRVRDFDNPIRLHSVSIDGLPIIDKTPRVRPADGHNLVRPVTRVIDREDASAELHQEIRPGKLVTIVGPGGVGKTRLAIDIGLRTLDRWPDGVWFVDLSSTQSAADVPLAVAEAIGVSPSPTGDAWAEVLDALTVQRSLLIIDNCEQLGPTLTEMIAQLQGCARDCAILVTSRLPLGLRSEHIVRLDGLAATGPDDPAITLLRERIGHRAATFNLDDTLDLCRALDGLPVAIEVAAGRLRSSNPADLLVRLRSSMGVLEADDLSLPPRHRSLDRLFEWSEQLLKPSARALLNSLSVIAGSFDLSMAEAVGSDDTLKQDDVAPCLWDLVDASLVIMDETRGSTRYRLLATVQQYVLARTTSQDRLPIVRRQALALVERLGPMQPIDRRWVGEMAIELDNIRGVLASLKQGSPDDAVLAQTLIWSVAHFHDSSDAFRSGIDEVGRWSDAFDQPTAERVSLLAASADLCLRVGENDKAEHLLDEAEAIQELHGSPAWDDVATVRSRGELNLRRGVPEQAVASARAALPRAGTARGRARLLNLLGIALYEIGDLAEAAAAFRSEIGAALEAGMETFLVNAHGNLAEALLQLGDNVGAAQHQLACLELRSTTSDDVHEGFFFIVAAHLAAKRGEWATAVRLHVAADVLLERAGFVMYDQDLKQRKQLLGEAREALGDIDFEAAASNGRSVDTALAARIATVVLQRVATDTGE
ncbi:MAG TPA: adenylate/guanylate cyclase domain-containing protein [Ilumatobacteraceae bacterium]|nr:adenylate/guanylate cyclase domain-containing protein [Ilumatobacteraceae bacterium]